MHRLPSLCDGGNPSVRSGGLKVVKPGDGWDMQAAAVACDALCITADLLDKFAACASGDACKFRLFPPKSARQNTRISRGNYPPRLTALRLCRLRSRSKRLQHHIAHRPPVPRRMVGARGAGALSRLFSHSFQRSCGLSFVQPELPRCLLETFAEVGAGVDSSQGESAAPASEDAATAG